MELIISQNKVALITSSPLYMSLCVYLIRRQCTDEVNKDLFASILQCSSSEVVDKLLFCHLSLRIKDVVTQLMKKKKVLEAISLKLSANGTHSRLLTVSSLL